MTESELILQFIKTFDSFVALAIAVWIIQVGIKRMDSLQTQYTTSMKEVLQQQQDNNDQLMNLVSTLCVQIQSPPAQTAPKSKAASP